MTNNSPPIAHHFLVITDPRADNRAHKLIDIIMIAICVNLPKFQTPSFF
jgi:hypothetical protein